MTHLVDIHTALKTLVSVHADISKIKDPDIRMDSYEKLFTEMNKLIPHFDPDKIQVRDDKGRFLPRPQNVDVSELKAISGALSEMVNKRVIEAKLDQISNQLDTYMTTMSKRVGDLEAFIRPPFT